MGGLAFGSGQRHTRQKKKKPTGKSKEYKIYIDKDVLKFHPVGSPMCYFMPRQ